MNHSEEWKAVEEALQEECSDVVHSPDGLCPCCGSELVNFELYYDHELEVTGYEQRCYACGWSSLPLYDA